MHCGSAPTHPRKRGFTIVELLVAIAIIAVLFGLIIVVLNRVAKSSQRANTQALLLSISTGLQQFREDVGYLPPVLGRPDGATTTGNPANAPLRFLYHPVDDDVLPEPPEDNDYFDAAQEYFSYTSLSEYLVGYGEGLQDGYGYIAQDETPVTGIRHPGRDGVWGATGFNGAGQLGDRNPPLDGKQLGAYIELKDNQLLASTDGTFDTNGNLTVYLPGEAGYKADDPKVLVDYWGRPIRFYRQLYRPGALNVRYRPYDLTVRQPNLGDVFLLRPWEIPVGTELLPDPLDLRPDRILADDSGERVSTRALLTAEFALFSSGPDQRYDATVRRDIDEFNEDNLVELGP